MTATTVTPAPTTLDAIAAAVVLSHFGRPQIEIDLSNLAERHPLLTLTVIRAATRQHWRTIPSAILDVPDAEDLAIALENGSAAPDVLAAVEVIGAAIIDARLIEAGEPVEVD